jgi:hypothetical protein
VKEQTGLSESRKDKDRKGKELFMLQWKHILPLLLLGLGLLAGCGSPSQKSTAGMGEIPEWVANPQVKQGIAVTECVPASDNYSLDRKEAVANARQRRIQADDETTTGTTFETVSKQLTEQTLKGSVPKKHAYEMLNEEKHMCVLLTMGGSQMEKFFDQLMKRSNANVSPQDEEILYQEFKAKQAQEEMKEELSGSGSGSE